MSNNTPNMCEKHKGKTNVEIAKILNTTPDFLLDSETTNADNSITQIKMMIAHKAKDMSVEDKMELIRLLTENK